MCFAMFVTCGVRRLACKELKHDICLFCATEQEKAVPSVA